MGGGKKVPCPMPIRNRVLLVDDDPADRAAVRRALLADSLRLGEQAADVREAESVTDALRALREEEFACVFLDHALPDGTGLDLLTEVRARGLSTPVIVLTGQRDEETVTELMRAGAADYIPKSFLSPDLVARSLRAALRFQEAERARRDALNALHVRDRAIAAAENGIAIADARLPDMPIVYVNPAFLALSGYPEEEVLGRNCRFLQGPDTDPATVQAMRDAIQEARPVQVMVRNYKKDGTPFWNEITVSPVLDAYGTLTHFVGIQTDITARIDAERILRDSEERYRSLIQATTQTVWVVDAQGAIPRPLPSWGAFTGQTWDEYRGWGWLNAVHPEDCARVSEACQEALRTETLYDTEYRLRAADGTYRITTARAVPIRDDAGTVIEWVGANTDVTEQRRTQRELARAYADLQAAFDREHRIAESLQRSLLNKPPCQALQGLEVETLYRAAWDEAQVGGDYYDVFALDGGRLALVVGDVSGKGLAAASRTAEIKFSLRAYLREHGDAAAALERLNAFLCSAQELGDDADGADEYFVVLTLAIVDTATGDATVAVAGAEPPLVLRPGGAAEEVRARGLPLGVSTKAAYQSLALTLGPGDLLLIATDGITEARRGREFLGLDGLARLAQDSLSRTPEQAALPGVAEAILAGAQEFAGGRLHDDVCLLLAHRPASL